MPGYPAAKSFTTNKKNPDTSQAYTNLKKTETLYENFSKNSEISNILVKKNGSYYNGPLYIDTSGCLESIGGYNVNNYELFLDIVKGRYSQYRRCSHPNKKDNIIPDQTYKISEGPFFIHDLSFNSCQEEFSLKYNFDLSYISQFPIENLTNFKFPIKIKIENINT